MSDFETALKTGMEKSILKMVNEGSFLASDYESRMKIPATFVKECWDLVDRVSLKKKIAERVESELADRIINHIAAELSSDIKQILSVKERREMIRGIARQHLEAIMAAGTNL
jgi:hypothetical protein